MLVATVFLYLLTPVLSKFNIKKKGNEYCTCIPRTVLDDIRETHMDIATGTMGSFLSPTRYSDVVFCFPPETILNNIQCTMVYYFQNLNHAGILSNNLLQTFLFK